MNAGPGAESGPLSSCEFLVIEYNPSDASMRVLDNLGYSARNRADALDDAERAAAAATGRGEPLQYVVIRVASEATFTSAC